MIYNIDEFKLINNPDGTFDTLLPVFDIQIKRHGYSGYDYYRYGNSFITFKSPDKKEIHKVYSIRMVDNMMCGEPSTVETINKLTAMGVDVCNLTEEDFLLMELAI